MELKFSTRMRPFVDALMKDRPNFWPIGASKTKVIGDCAINCGQGPINTSWELQAIKGADTAVMLTIGIEGKNLPVVLTEPKSVNAALQMLQVMPTTEEAVADADMPWLTAKVLKTRMHHSTNVLLTHFGNRVAMGNHEDNTIGLKDVKALLCDEGGYYKMTERAAKHFLKAIEGQTKLSQTLPNGETLHWAVTVDDTYTLANEDTVLTFSRVRP